MVETELPNRQRLADGPVCDYPARYEAGIAGALCDEDTRARLRQIGEAFDWRS